MKGEEEDMEFSPMHMQEEMPPAQYEQPEPVYAPTSNTKLTDKALSQLGSQKSASKPVKKKAGAKKGGKPAWAITPKMQEDQKENEVDDLIDFAYELDYEKYMEDYEVRQALAIIKDRVNEMKQDNDWKEKIAEEWN